MDKKTLRIVAGVLFVLDFVVRLYISVQGRVTAWSYVSPIAFLLIAVSLFANIPLLSTVGGIVLTVGAVRSLVLMLQRSIIDPYIIAEVIAFLLLAVAGLSRKSAKVLGILSALFYLLEEAIFLLSYNFVPTPRSILFAVLFFFGAVLLGIGFSGEDKKAVAISKSVIENNKLDRLVKLKDLLDKGVLTLEEFEAKKKQILGQ